MTALEPEVLDANFVWADERAALPAGICLHHGDHACQVQWALLPDDEPGTVDLVTLVSLQPITVVELVHCPMCGVSGHLSNGAFLQEASRG